MGFVGVGDGYLSKDSAVWILAVGCSAMTGSGLGLLKLRCSFWELWYLLPPRVFSAIPLWGMRSSCRRKRKLSSRADTQARKDASRENPHVLYNSAASSFTPTTAAQR